MKTALILLLSVIVVLLLLIGSLALSGLVFWGLGNVIIWLFGIDFNWTFYHGLGLEFVAIVIRLIFYLGRNK